MGRVFAAFILLAYVFCFSSAQTNIPRCLLSRLDFVECQYNNPRLQRAESNEFSVHHTLLREGQSGFVECLVRRRDQFVNPITDLGTEEMRIIYSSGFVIGEDYDNQLLMEYNVQCESGQLAFFNVTDIEIEGDQNCRDEDGNPRCQDYILIDRGQFGTTELCGNITLESEFGSLEEGKFTIFFRSSETTRGRGFRMFVVCFKPEERDQPDCFEAQEFNASVCGDGVSGSGMNLTEPGGDGRRKRDAGDEMTDVLDSYGFRMRKDLVEFHRRWQRRRRQISNIRFVERNILYSETVRYLDRTITVFDEDNEEVDRYDDIFILQTFDKTGTQRAFVEKDDGDPTPGPGPLYIVGRNAYFQLFAIDPRGLIPDEMEAMELEMMSAPLLNAVPEENDPNVTDPNQTIEPLRIPGIIDNRRRRQLLVEGAMEVDEEAVYAAFRSRESCNPVLRAQSRATLIYYRGLNSSAVDALETFPMTCSVDNMQLSCNTESTPLPGRTRCSIDEDDVFNCDTAYELPLNITTQLNGRTSYTLTVTAVNCNGQTGMATIRM